MALQSQGIQIKRSNTASLTTLTSSAIFVTSSGIEIQTSAAMAGASDIDFLEIGSSFTDNMRVEILSSNNNNTNIYTISTSTAVASKKITLWETVTADAATSHEVRGHTMVNIGAILSFSGPSGSRGILDVTHLGSSAKEKLVSMRDEGNLTLEVLFDSSATALHMQLKDDYVAKAKQYYEIELTDSTVDGSFLFFEAYVTAFSLSGAVEDAIKGSITLEITDQVRWTKSNR